jgi:hypothetical protein
VVPRDDANRVSSRYVVARRHAPRTSEEEDAMTFGRRPRHRYTPSSLIEGCRLAAVLVLLACGRAGADAVTDWNRFGISLIAPRPETTIAAAYVHIAIYDAINAIEGAYTPFAVRVPDVPPGASPVAAAAAAAHIILGKLYPSFQSQIDAEYNSALAKAPAGQGRIDGIAVGQNLRNLAAQQQIGLADDARFFAQQYVTLADSLVACWDSKYLYNFWRPVTAIRAADIDGNDATQPDPAWLPQIVTPGHPEYPAFAKRCGFRARSRIDRRDHGLVPSLGVVRSVYSWARSPVQSKLLTGFE